jgi:hypothetical protein
MIRVFFVILIVIFNLVKTLGIDPEREYKMTPETFAMEYQECQVITEDNYKINTWTIFPEITESKDIVIVISGSDAGNMGYHLPYAFHLVRRGYTVVCFDYRGFGASSDFKFDSNSLFHLEYVTDLCAVLHSTNDHLVFDRLGTMSFSMGTFISAKAYEHVQFDFYIAEAFYDSPKNVIQRLKQVDQKKIKLPKESRKEDISKLRGSDIPELLFAGGSDKITTLSDSLDFCIVKSNCRVINFDGGHLRGAQILGISHYIDKIENFLDT